MIHSIRVEDILSIFPAHDNLIQSDIIVIKLDMEGEAPIHYSTDKEFTFGFEECSLNVNGILSYYNVNVIKGEFERAPEFD